MLVIKMKNDLHMGKMYKLSIKYSKKLDDNPTKGIYMQKYTIGGLLSHYIVTNFAPMGARDVFPSFDEPNYPAKFKFQAKDEIIFS
jgi:aminopeptidase N